MSSGTTDRERGRQLGAEEYRPDIYPHGTLGRSGLADFAAATYFGMRVGIRAADLHPKVSDLGEFWKGVLEGADTAHTAHRESTESHARKPGCDAASPFGMCEYCEAYDSMMREAHANRLAWETGLVHPELEFVVGGAGSKVHTRECPAVTNMVRGAEAEMEWVTPAHARHGGHTVRWPLLLDREGAIAARRHRCGVCCPDLPDRRSQGVIKGSSGRFEAAPLSTD